MSWQLAAFFAVIFSAFGCFMMYLGDAATAIQNRTGRGQFPEVSYALGLICFAIFIVFLGIALFDFVVLTRHNL